MSFGNRTPESLLPRSDSKNPATTCKGLTSSGRPCRRALAASTTNSPVSNQDRGVTVLGGGDAAALLCWQHKDQADTLNDQLEERSRVSRLKQKSSIDTMIERVGILGLDNETEESPSVSRNNRKRGSHPVMTNKSTMPQTRLNTRAHLVSLPEEAMESESPLKQNGRTNTFRKEPERRYSDRVGRSNVKASWSCCIRSEDDDHSPAPSRRQRYEQFRPTQQNSTQIRPTAVPHRLQPQGNAVLTQARHNPCNASEMQQRHRPAARTDANLTRPSLQSRPSELSPPYSQTATFLSLIPSHLSPSTTSALLSELSRPISDADEEGYIYIFWLTPESDTSKPDDDVASCLLDPDDHLPLSVPRNHGRLSQTPDRQQATHKLTAQALQRFASVKRRPAEPNKILLKIGRAANVHRRLSQWTKQCGQNITLIRYYPYEQQQTPANSSQAKRTVPHVHRVERLIHLELADKRITDKGICQACGRVHKEWFEVDATREGVREVDEVVRRWVGWAEANTS